MQTMRERLIHSPTSIGLLAIGVGGLVGGVTALSPIVVAAALLALGIGVALLRSVLAGLVTVIAISLLLPFGTLPFKAIITPTLLSLAISAVLMILLLRVLARSDSYDVRLSSLGLPLIGFLGLTLFSLIRGAGGLPAPLTLHNYVKFVLAVLLFLAMVNGVQDRAEARLMVQTLIVIGALAAFVGLLLYALPDDLAERALTSLGRVGYPISGRVLRYVEDDPNGLERAIGTSVDPNSFGGMLALVSALAAAQIAATRPVLPRWSLIGATALMGLALALTFSRAALFGVVGAALYLATVRYRQLWWAIAGGTLIIGGILMGLGIADEFIDRIVSGVQFRDQAQQMRLAEYRNALAIIERYPWTGIGFGRAPEVDLVAGVSSIYLTIAQRLGLPALLLFLGLIGWWFAETWRAIARMDEEVGAWILGLQAGVVAALTVGLADHYFFNIEFSHMVALFWGSMGLGMAIVALENEEPSPTTSPIPGHRE